ncbi:MULTISPECIES: AraC family transcriptional regulator [Rhizobium]|uniref:AraC family transcriptional regulator n=1 Tax=Rhizobium tropici TaxID=398 RepID=A0A329YDL0_RHITR|nr:MULTISPECIES: AraC family transcriptional regulator [Rhizobium]MBB3285667.1 AraC-like DNA-binding protein [Rhizobium sp. BK252]MBB3400407.1 AraC-like DNA-binding protein [Rhizobium sp. BK289]MBB3412986.1 AraC-like DNA-binding protein [Rhizobium sp. BK284]MBB3480873.1 AraC-like DNA-binding protein [Rhizobium sp. BK347]MDK4721547.1 AraC family transcriptional regulator [Rhizobium sp. CNPSo 3968]
MLQFSTTVLLKTKSVLIRDVVCNGECRHKSDEECAHKTSLVYTYRGVFKRHVGQSEAVSEANQVVFFNRGQDYRISHPIEGGDSCLDLMIDEALLHELAPKEQIQSGEGVVFRRQRRRIDPRAQALVAMLRHGLSRNIAESLEGETLALTLVRRSLGERTSHEAGASFGRQKLVDRAKLVLTSDLARRWTLAEIAKEVGVSPVYLTQVFQQVEAMPLYRYQLRLRLARALDLLGSYDDLTMLGLDLGFSSHSHFSAAFKQTYGQTPAEFQRSAQLKPKRYAVR